MINKKVINYDEYENFFNNKNNQITHDYFINLDLFSRILLERTIKKNNNFNIIYVIEKSKKESIFLDNKQDSIQLINSDYYEDLVSGNYYKKLNCKILWKLIRYIGPAKTKELIQNENDERIEKLLKKYNEFWMHIYILTILDNTYINIINKYFKEQDLKIIRDYFLNNPEKENYKDYINDKIFLRNINIILENIDKQKTR